MKASEDIDFVDPTYETNRAQAKANGCASGPTTSPSRSHVVGDGRGRSLPRHGDAAAGDLLPVLDLERTGGLTDRS